MCNLSVKSISKNFKRKSALINVSCEFSRGITALLGPNGAGKSTLMNIISTLSDADSGTVEYMGLDINKQKALYTKKISVLFQNQPMYKNYTAYEYLLFCGALKDMKKKDVKEQAEKLLHYFGIFDNRKKRISVLSGGMKQRLALCGVFLGNPEIILLDEPSVGLDIYEREELKSLLCRLKEKATIIISTHIVSDIENISDNIILLNNGQISALGTQEELIYGLKDSIWKLPIAETCEYDIKTYSSNGILYGVSKNKPHPDAEPKKVELTDVYFSYI